ncbi:MAG: sensor histidine kinase [Hyphomicrobiaceae bacterium]
MVEKITLTWRALKQWLTNLSLVQQFALAGSIVVVIAMTVIGRWVAIQIETGVVNSTSAATALYMDAVLAPVVSQLTSGKKIEPAVQQKIDQILARTELGQKVISIKIWKKGGVVAYSNQPDLIGKTFKPSKHLKQAWSGTVSAEFDSLHDDEDAYERASGLTLLEMYMPVRDKSHGKIIAVAEFYVLGEPLNTALSLACRRSWLLVGVVSLAMMAALFGIVLRGNRTIEVQRTSLESKLDQNTQLHSHVQQAYRRAENLKERFLRKVGADLHDGPAQLIGLALLRLDSLRPSNAMRVGSCGTQEASFDIIHDTLKEALEEIRKQSAGLALPELEDADSCEAIELAIAGHEKRTDTQVARRINIPNHEVPEDIKVCLYRFVQEGLNNSFRHGDAADQEVRASINGSGFHLAVNDRGPGTAKHCEATDGHGIGLIALRDRVETLGGTFSFKAREGGGCSLTAQFDQKDLFAPDV